MLICVPDPTPERVRLARLYPGAEGLRLEAKPDHLEWPDRIVWKPFDDLKPGPNDLICVSQGFREDNRHLPDPSNAAEMFRLNRFVVEGMRRYPGCAWEMFNEANATDPKRPNDFFRDATPAKLVGCLASIRKSVRESGVSGRIVAGSLAIDRPDWLPELLRLGIQDHIDVLAAHPYHDARIVSPEAHAYKEVRRLKALGVTLPIAFTEVGYKAGEMPLCGVAPRRGVDLMRTLPRVIKPYRTSTVSSGFYAALDDPSLVPDAPLLVLVDLWADSTCLASVGVDDAAKTTVLVDQTPRTVAFVGRSTTIQGKRRIGQAYGVDGAAIRWDSSTMRVLPLKAAVVDEAETRADLIQRFATAAKAEGVVMTGAYSFAGHPAYDLAGLDGKPLAASLRATTPMIE